MIERSSAARAGRGQEHDANVRELRADRVRDIEQAGVEQDDVVVRGGEHRERLIAVLGLITAGDATAQIDLRARYAHAKPSS